MPPRPISRSVVSVPMRAPGASGGGSQASSAATVGPAVSRKFPARSWADSRSSTRPTSSLSPPALARTKASRSAAGTSFAASKSAVMRCHRVIWSISLSSGLELAKEKRPRQCPAPLQRRRRDLERLGGFLHRDPAEKSKLDEPRVHRVHCREPLERLIEREHIDRGVRRWQQALVERDALAVPAPLGGVPRPHPFDQNLSHQPGGDPEKMCTVPR